MLEQQQHKMWNEKPHFLILSTATYILILCTITSFIRCRKMTYVSHNRKNTHFIFSDDVLLLSIFSFSHTIYGAMTIAATAVATAGWVVAE